MNEIETAFIAKIKTCRNCGTLRISLDYNMLSDKMKEVFKMFGDKAEYLYCGNCDEFSSLSDWEGF